MSEEILKKQQAKLDLFSFRTE